MDKREVKTTRTPRAKAQVSARQRRKIAAAEALSNHRIAFPMCVAEVDAKKKRVSNNPRAMLLVNDVLSPVDPETSALALMDLVGFFCDMDKKEDRIELAFYCTVQSVLHLKEWKAYLHAVLTAARNQRTKKK